MNREAAKAEADRLRAEHPERTFTVREEGPSGEWRVVQVSLPGGKRIDPLKATVESRPQPDHPDDPRSSLERNLGGPYGPA